MVSTKLPTTVSLAGIAAPVLDYLRAVRPNIPWQVRELETIGGSLCASVLASDPFQIAVKASTERTYLGPFGAWVDVRVRSGVPVFLDRGIDGVNDVWHSSECVAYAFATKKLRSATIESHL